MVQSSEKRKAVKGMDDTMKQKKTDEEKSEESRRYRSVEVVNVDGRDWSRKRWNNTHH